MDSELCLVRLYILPAPLAREAPYWMYPYWGEVAREVKHFFVERAARARPLLEKVGVSPAIQLYEYDSQIEDWPLHAYETVFRSRASAALLSESGLAGVADPGRTVVQRAHAEGYAVIPLAGPSSITLALSASGLSGQAFTFWGYPPIEKRQRRQFLQKVISAAAHMTQILMETPARSSSLLGELIAVAPPDLYLCVAHHLTAAEGWVRTQPVALWQPMDLPKAPTLFLLGRM